MTIIIIIIIILYYIIIVADGCGGGAVDFCTKICIMVSSVWSTNATL